MPGTAVLCFQMILKIRVAEAPVVMIAAHRFHGIEAAVLAALIAAVLAGIAVVEAQAAVLAEVICVVRIHCAHSLGAVGVALAALLAQLAGFAELVLVFLIRDPAVAARQMCSSHSALSTQVSPSGQPPASELSMQHSLHRPQSSQTSLASRHSSHCSQDV